MSNQVKDLLNVLVKVYYEVLKTLSLNCSNIYVQSISHLANHRSLSCSLRFPVDVIEF